MEKWTFSKISENCFGVHELLLSKNLKLDLGQQSAFRSDLGS